MESFILGFVYLVAGFILGLVVSTRLLWDAYKIHKLNKEMLSSLDQSLTGWKESIAFIEVILPHITGEQMMKIGEDLFNKHKLNEQRSKGE